MRVLTRSILLAWVAGCGSEHSTVQPPPPPPPPVPHYFLIDEEPSWSADGTAIVYYHSGITEIHGDNPVADPDSVGLAIVDTSGTDSHLVLNAWVVQGRFARLDNSIAIHVASQSGIQIYHSRLNGGYLEPLTQLTTAGGFRPPWSFDDEFIAYESSASGQYKIWRMKANGEENRLVPLEWGPRVYDVDWFPSGDRIVGSTYDIDMGNYELVVFDTAGTVVSHLAITCPRFSYQAM